MILFLTLVLLFLMITIGGERGAIKTDTGIASTIPILSIRKRQISYGMWYLTSVINLISLFIFRINIGIMPLARTNNSTSIWSYWWVVWLFFWSILRENRGIIRSYQWYWIHWFLRTDFNFWEMERIFWEYVM